MRDIPIVFPISLAIILAMLVFTGAYAISASAVEGGGVYSTPSGAVVSIDTAAGGANGATGGEYDWYQQAALFVCPLH